MKKTLLFLTLLGLFIACEKNKVIDDASTKKSNTDTIPTPIVNDEDKNTTETDSVTKIDSTECYMLQACNELGEPIDAYECIKFEKNAGCTFEEAYASIKNDLDLLVARMINDEKDGGIYDVGKWEIRQVIRQVKNSPNDKLVYTSIELYMFSVVYNVYTIVYQFWVIDSEGNIYQIVGPSGENEVML